MREMQQIAQHNTPKNETFRLDQYNNGQDTKTIARRIHYSQKQHAHWTLKIVEDPRSCISLSQDETAVLDANMNVSAKKEASNALYLWNLRIQSVGTAKLQATYTSPEKTETQEFTITIVN